MNIAKADLLNRLIYEGSDRFKEEPLKFREVIYPSENSYQSDMMYYLRLQVEIMRETREYEAISNIMKAKHDAATNAIRNIR